MPRTEAVAKVWAYVRERGLQDPANEQAILADDDPHAVFDRDRCTMFEMQGLLSPHLAAACRQAVRTARRLDAATARRFAIRPSFQLADRLAHHLDANQRRISAPLNLAPDRLSKLINQPFGVGSEFGAHLHSGPPRTVYGLEIRAESGREMSQGAC